MLFSSNEDIFHYENNMIKLIQLFSSYLSILYTVVSVHLFMLNILHCVYVCMHVQCTCIHTYERMHACIYINHVNFHVAHSKSVLFNKR